MRVPLPFVKKPPLVAVLRLQGGIGTSGRMTLSAARIAPLLEKAFRSGRPAAVALEINSPGGSPVQASLIGAHIRALAEKNKIPVLAFVEDVAASGGYWLAAAADEIWADESSIIGSIGVISAGFGAHEFLARHGIERRVHTAGRSKSMLDPFRPEDPEDVARLDATLDQVHRNFIAHVRARRGARLDEAADLFTGDIWLGRRAQELGLIDGIAHLVPKLRERFGDKVRLRRFGQKRPLLARLGAETAQGMLAGLEERAAFARFGL
ncbi:S49 family peptidase [Pontibaca methylaminivorans]|uniref:S49 family peptidase n=1 Tax=Pontibaca methylaminivorans TaxID=515897 RepID=UPI002FDAC29C